MRNYKGRVYDSFHSNTFRPGPRKRGLDQPEYSIFTVIQAIEGLLPRLFA